jgi:acyl-CoA-dependent ceramide synthase
MAKMLNYLGGGWACDGMFSLFVLSWIVTRHYIFPKIIWSIYAELPSEMPWIWNPSQGYFFCTSYWVAFLVLLSLLEVLLIVWLWLILRIMWGVVIGKGADDERSDSEFVPSLPFSLLLAYPISHSLKPTY